MPLVHGVKQGFAHREGAEAIPHRLQAHLLMSKNKKRLTDPRGDGEGARSNSMSMF